MSEIRYSSMQLAGGEGRLVGVIMRYGELGQGPGGMPERFLPGAFGPDVGTQDVILNSMHLRPFPLARTSGGGLELTDSDSMLSMTADLTRTQPGREALEQVKAQVLRGLSVEFTAREERQAGGTREIVRARLDDLGLVDRAAYSGSTIEVRQEARQRNIPKLLATLRGNVPSNTLLDCRCSPGDCRQAVFEPGAFDKTRAERVALAEVDRMQDAVDRALDRADAARARAATAAEKLQARRAAQDVAERERQQTLEESLRAEERRVVADERARTARPNERLAAQRQADQARLNDERTRERARDAQLALRERKAARELAERSAERERRETERLRQSEASERKNWQAAQDRAAQAAAAQERDVLAVVGQYNQGLGSTSRGSLRLRPDGDGGLNFFVDVRDTERGRTLMETFSSTDIFGRPYIDTSASVFSINGQTAVYTGVILSAIVLGPSDQNLGWQPLEEIDAADEAEEAAEEEARHIIIIPPPVAHRRRVWL